MEVGKEIFGEHNGEDIYQFILENDNGMIVKVMEYGATVTTIIVPDREGTPENITCGFEQFEHYFTEEYIRNAPYFGSTVGRYASFMGDGRFEIDGAEYSLATNAGPNHLHGGEKGFDKRVWSGTSIVQDSSVGVSMSLQSPHMEEGYPGNVEVTVEFTLNNDNELVIKYGAETDKITPLSLTNHAYFNLNGFSDDILSHETKIHSDSFLVFDDTNVAHGEIKKGDGTAADLRNGRVLKEAFEALPNGFEHYYLLNRNLDEMSKAAEITHPQSGRQLIVSTTEPGFLFYTGRYTSDKLSRENGQQFGPFRAFCCETSRYPNGPNIPDSPGSLTTPEEPYTSKTVYKFVTTGE